MPAPDLQTLFIARNYIELAETDSTNTYAQNMLAGSPPPDGTAILTYRQVQGRGQRQAVWESEPYMNLTFSLILYPGFVSARNSFLLSKAVALGVYDYARTVLGNDVKIKWPNDIYFKDRKICGILIENSLRGTNVSQSVIGIGLNINQIVFQSSSTAASFKSITNSEYNLPECFATLCHHIEGRYLQLKTQKSGVINNDYLEALYSLNEVKAYKAGEETFMAKITGISDEGKLLLQLFNGDVRSFSFKEVSYTG